MARTVSTAGHREATTIERASEGMRAYSGRRGRQTKKDEGEEGMKVEGRYGKK